MTPATLLVSTASRSITRGELLVGDRSGSRIEIFDQEGKFIAEWKQFGRPSGIYVDKKDNIYVVDADSNSKSHPGWQRGMRIGSAKDGSVKYFIPDPNSDPNFFASSAAEGVHRGRQGRCVWRRGRAQRFEAIHQAIKLQITICLEGNSSTAAVRIAAQA